MKLIKNLINKIKSKYASWKRARLLKKAIKNAKTDRMIYD